MTEDFALIDFALSVRSPAEIAEALARAQAAPSRANPEGGGVLSRLLRRFSGGGAAPGTTRSTLSIQPPGTLGAGPLTRPVATDMGFSGPVSPVRLSSPIGVAGLTLIEFREGDDETSHFCEALSAQLRGDEMFYFRYSGGRHPGAHFAFHIYQDGRMTRRAISFSPSGTAPEADWHGIDSGMPHPVETDSLPPPGVTASEIMTPARQSVILESLGVDPESLFMEMPDTLTVLELSDAPGGAPLSSARSVIEARTPKPEPVTPPAPAPQAAPEPVPAEPVSASAEPDDPERSWEDEVTRILVEAAESALPPEIQVAWLDSLTARLVSGDIDSALADARQMIDRGRRTPAQKHAAAARLAELFGREG
ncbi:hypothetical protein [Tropicimonas isoalkanivorans]|uniref:Uncharacterized protein n=1 Tax=Tropicimonas isoalkanivorans TaxID=441112 RepID=A0A1I1D629_9RHOB|nr:hypothetical protein [Tropicimonas isoalkanivorans]SFB70469.1 hypothetical protein SAMN04488094_10123 [Tropicimonas isoalkanivorans]